MTDRLVRSRALRRRAQRSAYCRSPGQRSRRSVSGPRRVLFVDDDHRLHDRGHARARGIRVWLLRPLSPALPTHAPHGQPAPAHQADGDSKLRLLAGSCRPKANLRWTAPSGAVAVNLYVDGHFITRSPYPEFDAKDVYQRLLEGRSYSFQGVWENAAGELSRPHTVRATMPSGCRPSRTQDNDFDVAVVPMFYAGRGPVPLANPDIHNAVFGNAATGRPASPAVLISEMSREAVVLRGHTYNWVEMQGTWAAECQGRSQCVFAVPLKTQAEAALATDSRSVRLRDVLRARRHQQQHFRLAECDRARGHAQLRHQAPRDPRVTRARPWTARPRRRLPVSRHGDSRPKPAGREPGPYTPGQREHLLHVALQRHFQPDGRYRGGLLPHDAPVPATLDLRLGGGTGRVRR